MTKAIEKCSIKRRKFQAVAFEFGITFVCRTCGHGLVFSGQALLSTINVKLDSHNCEHRVQFYQRRARGN